MAEIPQFAIDLWRYISENAKGKSGEIVLTSLYAAIETLIDDTLKNSSPENRHTLVKSVMSIVSHHNLTLLTLTMGGSEAEDDNTPRP